MKRIYIAGPYTGGETTLNVRIAVEAGQRIADAGAIPFVPHLYHLWHLLIPGPYEQWMRFDLAWLEKCDALVRLPGESPGADREVAEAERLGLPVFYGVDAFLEPKTSEPLTPVEIARLAELEAEQRSNSLGDRPHRMAVKKLRELLDLSARSGVVSIQDVDE